MEKPLHRFTDLFAQLGLAHDALSIRQFIGEHSPLPPDFRLADAPFWTPAQATFLRESVQQDADWAELADQLNNALRAVDADGPTA